MSAIPSNTGDPAVAFSTTPRRRVSWGAIWAGMFVTVIMAIMFTLLGVACGISSLDPFSRAASARGLSIGADIWLMISWLISIFVGARVAGWMSGGPRSADGTAHGIVVWAFSVAIIFLLVSGTVGALLGSNPASNGYAATGSQAQVPGSSLAPTGRTGTQPPADSETTNGQSSGGNVPFWGSALFGFIALILGLGVAAWGGASGVASEFVPTVSTRTVH